MLAARYEDRLSLLLLLSFEHVENGLGPIDCLVTVRSKQMVSEHKETVWPVQVSVILLQSGLPS